MFFHHYQGQLNYAIALQINNNGDLFIVVEGLDRTTHTF